MIHFPLEIPWQLLLNSDFANSSLIGSLESTLQEASIALALFESSREEHYLIFNRIDLAQMKDVQERQYNGSSENSTNEAPSIDPEIYQNPEAWIKKHIQQQERELVLQDRQRRLDRILDWIPQKAMLLHARSFLYSLDRIRQILKKLAATGPFAEYFGDALKQVCSAFPNLREHRNSSAHIEDRLTKTHRSVADGFSMFISESLADRNYQNSLTDGTVGSIEVSVETLSMFQGILQAIFNKVSINHP